jgi:hypothetical protein
MAKNRDATITTLRIHRSVTHVSSRSKQLVIVALATIRGIGRTAEIDVSGALPPGSPIGEMLVSEYVRPAGAIRRVLPF